MKTKTILFLSLLGAILSLVLLGCVTKTADPSKPGGYSYTPDPAISNRIYQAGKVGDAVAPLAGPYGGFVRPAIEGIGGLILAGAALIAKIKQNKADAVSQTLAHGIVSAGEPAKLAVLDVASSTPHFAAVAEHINNATP